MVRNKETFSWNLYRSARLFIKYSSRHD